jgi:hypothetical protein
MLTIDISEGEIYVTVRNNREWPRFLQPVSHAAPANLVGK